jgi:eukaryotic-like serine/threonine-protein kinase
VGERLGPYEILASIGAGGMGEVYKALDTRLDRIVALKVSKAEFSKRFEREARTVAALNHPHICQLYDVGPDYLVMEYVEGAPLQCPLPAEEVILLAIQIASALEEAHSRGIIHRDLKPGNILVNSKGATKLLDFGLAKLLESDPARDAFETLSLGLTEAGAVVGTVAYMSPEQAQGQEVDARSDIFSFGLVLYEMVSGRRAFPGKTAIATMSAIMKDEPSPMQGPAALERIVQRCLAKQPSARYQTIAEVKAELEKGSVKAVEQQPSIAVLPFANMSADKENEYFSDGLAEDIINILAHIPGLKVIARTSAFAFRGKEQDIRKIGEALGVRTILEGSVRRAGNRIRVTAQLINAEDGSHLWSSRYDRELADVFAIQDEIAQAITHELRVKLSLRPRYTPNLAAYEALLRGRHHRQKLTPAGHLLARECFERAIVLDPGYAAPHAELGLDYLTAATTNVLRPMIESASSIQSEAQHALELDPSESNPYFLLASVAAVHDYDRKRAAEYFAQAMGGDSVSADARWAYSSFYLQPEGRYREGAEQFQAAVEQDPLNVGYRAIFGHLLLVSSRYDEAMVELRRALEIDDTH